LPRLINNQYLKHFQNRGVPPGVLFANFSVDYEDVISQIRYGKDDKEIIISRFKQLDFLGKIFNLNKAYLTVITGQNHDTIANQIALLVALRSVSKNSNKPFYWHQLLSNTYDKLRDDENMEELLSDCGLLILSGIAANSTNMKIEKARDILTKFSDIPRIVTAAGLNPLELSFNVLYTKPSYVLYFGREV
jgi:hypothetical protein